MEIIWQIRDGDQEDINNLLEQLDVEPIIARILVNRGLKTPQRVEDFLDFDLQRLNDPYLLPDMKKAVARIERAIDKEEKIIIYGDYDVDGITSTSLLLRYLKSKGAKIDYYIPNRLNEGYGMNMAALDALDEQGADLIITVDCGIKAFVEIDYANKLGIDVIVTDHHTVADTLPQAIAVVNPKRKASSYPFKELAGVGVAFKLAQALELSLKGGQWPVLVEYLPLVALGTIADIVPLNGENRLIVKYGLEGLNHYKNDKSTNPGLAFLIEALDLTQKRINGGRVGYILAPPINASGRLGNPELAVKLLLADDYFTAHDLAHKLVKLNEERREISARIFREAEAAIEQLDLDEEWALVLASSNWHAGVIGNVASDLNEKYHRPVILIALDEDGTGPGSARSISGFDIHEALVENEELLIRFGGHKQAAGFSIKEENIPEFREGVNSYAHQVLEEQDLIPKTRVDGEIEVDGLSMELVEKLEDLAPFGYGNPKPVFMAKNLELANLKRIGKPPKHLKLYFKTNGKDIGAIAFSMADLKGRLLAKRKDIAALFNLEINQWQGKSSLQLNIKDFKLKLDSFVEQIFARKDELIDKKRSKNKEFYTKIKVIDDKNKINNLRVGDKLNLIKESNKRAIKIITEGKEEVGCLKSNLAHHLASYLDVGVEYESFISKIAKDENGERMAYLFIEKKDKLKSKENKLDYSRNKLRKLTDEKLKEILNNLEEGTDTLVVSNGGYQRVIWQKISALMAIKSNETVLVLSPLRSLANQHYQLLKDELSSLGLNIYKGAGDLSLAGKERLNYALRKKKIDIIIVTPQFLDRNLDNFGGLKERIGLVVVDESHYFKESFGDYRLMNSNLKLFDAPKLLATTQINHLELLEDLKEEIAIQEVVVDNDKSNMKLVDQRGRGDKEDYISNLIKEGQKMIVYVKNNLASIRVVSELKRLNPKFKREIIFYNRALTKDERKTIEQKFKDDQLKVVVATELIGNGLSVVDIRHLIFYNLTSNLSQFMLQSSQVGLDNHKSYIHLLYNKNDKRALTDQVDREVLLGLYVALSKSKNDKEEIIASDKELTQFVSQYSKKKVSIKAIKIALGILEELELISIMREEIRRIKLYPKPKKKLDLNDSIRYNEDVILKKILKQWEELAYGDMSELV